MSVNPSNKSATILAAVWCKRNPWLFNPLRPRQNDRHFADDTFNRIFVNEYVRIWIKFSLKFVLKGPINNIPALVQIMAWRRPGDKPLFEPGTVSLLTHICVTRPQWVKAWWHYGDRNIFHLYFLFISQQMNYWSEIFDLWYYLSLHLPNTVLLWFLDNTNCLLTMYWFFIREIS